MAAPQPTLLSPDQIAEAAARLPRWQVVDNHHLRRRWSDFPDFRSALAFAHVVGREAEAAGHHPDLSLGWGYLSVTLTTHDLGGLSQLDFELATRLDQLPVEGHPDPFRSST